MKDYTVNVVLDETFSVEAETEDDAIAEAVRRALDYPGAMSVDAMILSGGDDES